MEKQKHLPEAKQEMLEKWKTSGKSLKQYCQEENIPYHFMSYWHRKQKYIETGKDKKFIKVKIKTPLLREFAKTELVFSNGNRIIFHGAINMKELKQLAA